MAWVSTRMKAAAPQALVVAAEHTGPSPCRRRARIVLRPIANPLPLGFLALARRTLLWSARCNSDGSRPTRRSAMGLILIAFVVPLQLVASIFAFLPATSWPAPGWDPRGNLALDRAADRRSRRRTTDRRARHPAGTGRSRHARAGHRRRGGQSRAPGSSSSPRRCDSRPPASTTHIEPDWKTIAGVAGVVLAVLAVYAALGHGPRGRGATDGPAAAPTRDRRAIDARKPARTAGTHRASRGSTRAALMRPN